MGKTNDVCWDVFYVDWKAIIRTMASHILVGRIVKIVPRNIFYSLQEVLLGNLFM
jgi:hypothetical protein